MGSIATKKYISLKEIYRPLGKKSDLTVNFSCSGAPCLSSGVICGTYSSVIRGNNIDLASSFGNVSRPLAICVGNQATRGTTHADGETVRTDFTRSLALVYSLAAPPTRTTRTRRSRHDRTPPLPNTRRSDPSFASTPRSLWSSRQAPSLCQRRRALRPLTAPSSSGTASSPTCH